MRTRRPSEVTSAARGPRASRWQRWDVVQASWLVCVCPLSSPKPEHDSPPGYATEPPLWKDTLILQNLSLRTSPWEPFSQLLRDSPGMLVGDAGASRHQWASGGGAQQALPRDVVFFHSCWQTSVAPLSPRPKSPVAQLPWKLTRTTLPHSLGTVGRGWLARQGGDGLVSCCPELPLRRRPGQRGSLIPET